MVHSNSINKVVLLKDHVCTFNKVRHRKKRHHRDKRRGACFDVQRKQQTSLGLEWIVTSHPIQEEDNLAMTSENEIQGRDKGVEKKMPSRTTQNTNNNPTCGGRE